MKVKELSEYKFSFKKDRATGPYASFQVENVCIKHRGGEVGYINDGFNYGRKKEHYIHLQVRKEKFDDNDNCDWRWAKIKFKFDTVEEAKQWLNDNRKKIFDTYELILEEDR